MPTVGSRQYQAFEALAQNFTERDSWQIRAYSHRRWLLAVVLKNLQ